MTGAMTRRIGEFRRPERGHRASGDRVEPAMTITIFLAEHQAIVREGVRRLLENQRGFRVVGQASEGHQTIRLLERLKPRVLVVAMAMPGRNALDITREVRRRGLKTAIVVLTMYGEERCVLDALRSVVSAYVTKQARSADLVRAIRRAAGGQRYVSVPWSRYGVGDWLRRADATAINGGYTALTAREREIFELVIRGESSARIARRLAISRRTAEAHRANVMRKLHVTSYVDLVRYGAAYGLLDLSGGEWTPGRGASD